MSVWDWVFHFRLTATEEEDNITHILFLYSQANTPDQQLSRAEEGYKMAEQLGLDWWKLLFEHLRIQTLLYYKGDYQAGLEAAIRATVEARKAVYDQSPQRICVHEDLIRAHLGIDPLGQSEMIEQALHYMENEIAPDYECRFCLQALKISMHLVQDQFEDAQKAAEYYLGLTEEDNHHHWSDACGSLSYIAAQRGQWKKSLDWSQKGEKIAQKGDKDYDEAEHLAWQAVAYSHLGQEQKALQAYQKAVAKAASTSHFMPYSYYEALSQYHEACHEPQLALKIWERYLEKLKNQGQHFKEFNCRRECCRLRAQLGQPLEPLLSEAKALAQKLKNPERYLKELDEAIQ